MTKIYDGGFNAPLINGLKPVNCGAHIVHNFITYEAMSREFSGHPTNIISRYLNVIGENYEKVEISGWLVEDNNYETMEFLISFYNQQSSTHKYRSSNKMAAKWRLLFQELRDVHKEVFNGRKENQ